MDNKAMKWLTAEVQHFKETLNQHLIESGGIKAQLAINTWLTGGILFVLLAQFLKDFIRR